MDGVLVQSVKKASLATLVLTSLIAATPAAAEEEKPRRGVYLGVFGGANLVLGDWDLHEVGNSRMSPHHSPMGGIRLGVDVLSWLGLEGSVAVMPFSSDAGDTNLNLDLRVDGLLYVFGRKNWVPFIDVGFGSYANLAGDHGKDADYHLQWGLGSRGALTDWLILRFDARHVVSDASEEPFSNNLELMVGLDFMLASWGSDRDADEGDDAARFAPPPEPPPAETAPPPAETAPTSPPASQDTKSGDAGDDDDDAEIDLPEDDETSGGAGQDDAAPAPTRPAPASTDASRGGAEPAAAAAPKAKVRLKRLPMIFFAKGSAKLSPAAQRTLRKVAKALETAGGAQLRLEGHADRDGSTEGNQALSEERSAAVKDYLVGLGVDTSRLETVGYGEARPAVRDATAAAQAKNRRVELTIVSQ
jgi:peptidoglycan-associated lipoprotein